MVLGTASVRAQVRIGGNGAPNAAAVLDLNVDDSATPAGNKGALALPRVSLASTTAQLNGATPVTGMLVYNTNASMTNGNGAGIYAWDGTKWSTVVQAPSLLANTVLWSKIFDATVSRGITTVDGAFVTATTPGVVPTDVCFAIGDWGEAATSVTNGVVLVNLTGTQSSTTTRIACYRPYMLN